MPLPIKAVALALLGGLIAAGSDLRAGPEGWRASWPATDVARHSVDLAEIIAGGPPKDGIPALFDPTFVAADEGRIGPREPVLAFAPEGDPARAYPNRSLTSHEIVNDVAGGRPIAVTYRPLRNTGMVFDAQLDGVAQRFGVTGLLRASDMVMYDHETQSWWQQATGEAIVGARTGARLTQLPAVMDGWEGFRRRHPDGLVMDEPDWPRDYGRNPYAGYDTGVAFLYDGEPPPHGIPPLARVVRVGSRAWTLERLRDAGRIEEAGVTLTWEEGQASALDAATIGGGREVGTVRARDANGRDLPYDVPFAFAFHAFHPDGVWMLGD